MTKQGVKQKYQRTLNDRYEMYSNSMRRIINTYIHETQIIRVQVIYYHLDLGGTITAYCNPLGT